MRMGAWSRGCPSQKQSHARPASALGQRTLAGGNYQVNGMLHTAGQ